MRTSCTGGPEFIFRRKRLATATTSTESYVVLTLCRGDEQFIRALALT